VRDKGLNQRTLLRRNAPESSEKKEALSSINNALFELEKADSLASLLGYEGLIARFYFKEFASLLKGGKYTTSWDFEARNRRPPKDPVNAMLSFAYSLLAKECACALFAEGLDPYWGFYHQPRHGRPALALDIMEPLRPLVADSAVITAINTSMVRDSDFEINPSGCAMSDRARKALLKAYEGRLDQLVTHPLFEYRCSWRSVIRLQARLLSRYLRKDIPSYQNIVTR
jgi:CRISPR-associated protein Cas1